jgi:preprotein translocase subunit SecE
MTQFLTELLVPILFISVAVFVFAAVLALARPDCPPRRRGFLVAFIVVVAYVQGIATAWYAADAASARSEADALWRELELMWERERELRR